MSAKDISRRATVETSFDGVNITPSIKPYLLSLSYTDVEGGESDDLQIVLQDRDRNWLQWITDILNKAGETKTAEQPAGVGTYVMYVVTEQTGLNVRKGPSKDYAIFTTVPYGTGLKVTQIKNGWAEIDFSGGTYYVSANHIQKVGTQDSDSDEKNNPVEYGCFRISATIIRQNWNGDGKDDVLDCGQFELDAISFDGAPNTVTIKGTSLPFSSSIRQTERSQAWESYKLSGIVREIAGRNGMACVFASSSDPYYKKPRTHKRPGQGVAHLVCTAAPVRYLVRRSLLSSRTINSERSHPSASHIRSRCSRDTRSASS